jgi:hypothetical protein
LMIFAIRLGRLLVHPTGRVDEYSSKRDFLQRSVRGVHRSGLHPSVLSWA